MSHDLATLDASAQAELIRSGEASPRELVDAAIARIEKLNPELNAVIHERFDAAREEASSGDLPDGPYRGVPFLLKDLGGNMAGEPYHAGMALLKRHDFRAARDAYFTERIRKAGFVILGRTNTPELGVKPITEPLAYGPSRNPWDTSCSPGGSSGGASAAVASGMVPAAHASDGGGSIRIPAAHAGLVGLKPTRGRSSFGPDLGDRWNGFSVELVVSKSVRDTAGILDVTHGPAPGDPYYAAPPSRPWAEWLDTDPGRLRIGLLERGPRGIEIDSACRDAARTTAEALRELGHEVVESHPESLESNDFGSGVASVIMCNTARALEAWGEKLGVEVGCDDVEPMTWALAEIGRKMPSTELLRHLERIHSLSRETAAWWQSGFDLLLTPTCGAPPPRIGGLEVPDAPTPLAAFAKTAIYAIFTSPFNATGQPGISLPMHWSEDGLPIGAQLVADHGREDLLIAVATQLEKARPWQDRRAPLHA